MTLIGAEFYVEVDGISASHDVLGSSLKVVRAGERFRIELPTDADSFSFGSVGPPTVDGGPSDPREYAPTVALLKESESSVQIRLVRVVVNIDAPLSVEGFRSLDPIQRELHDSILLALRDKATDIVSELCDRLNLEVNQHWIEPRGRYPRVVNMAGLIDLDAGMTFGTQIGNAGSFRVIDSDSILDASALTRLENSFEEGALQADELLLAEARHLIEGEFGVALERSVLLSAIAVELRIKRLLRRLAEPDLTRMVDLLLDNPNDWSRSPHGLFLKALPVLLGVEDVGREHRALAKRVQRLFTSRNRIAHVGASLTRNEAVEHVATAVDAFGFMKDISQSQPEGIESAVR
jgi:hypothetical protein